MISCTKLQLLIGVTLSLTALWGCNTNNIDTISPSPQIFIKTPTNGFEVDISDTLFLEPQVIYDNNSTYQWSLNGEVIPNSNSRIMMVIPNQKYGTNVYQFKVSNEFGFDIDTIAVKALVKVDFEEFKLDANKYSIGYNGKSIRTSKILNLPVTNDSVKNYWSGFAFSNQYRTTQSDSAIYQFNAYSLNGGDEKSKNFLVFYEDIFGNDQFLSFNDGKSHTLGTVAITNSAYAYWIMKIGDISPKANPFTSPKDWFVVTISGYDENGLLTKELNYPLADFTSTNRNDNYIIDTWTNIDLSALGNVSKVGFKFSSSDTNSLGINTPTYVCIDNIRIIE